MRNSRGQTLIVAIVLLTIVAILIPALIKYTQHEASWTLKEQRTTGAFELAESAVERGYQQMLLSTSTWANIQLGMIPAGFNFDQIYSGLSNGQYEIRLASGPQTQQATVVGVGRDISNNEIRAVKAVYSNLGAANQAIYAGNTVTVGGSVNVEWGAVTSYTSIVSAGRTHPRFYSSGNIDLDSNGSSPPNTDNIQWWSYQPNLPPLPQVDLTYYQGLAQNAGTSPPAGCPANYYTAGPITFSGCVDSSGNTYYATGDINFASGGTNFIKGNVVTLGNVSNSGNGGTGAGSGIYTTPIPPLAWKEYGNAWSTYKCMDSYANSNFATYAAAVAANYRASVTVNIPNGCINGAGSVLVHGFIYAGGGSGLSGGGNGRYHGVIITPNTATVSTSNFTVYFDDTVAAAIRTKNVSLSRSSWQDWNGCAWSGTNPTCP